MIGVTGATGTIGSALVERLFLLTGDTADPVGLRQDVVERLTGRPPARLRAFAGDHADELRRG